ncbi:MAG: hypothetical protein CMJ49_06700 [Planctomycetaceae bacterium]|nr:hypothetical protein [Planctomycetaceae bacterium]
MPALRQRKDSPLSRRIWSNLIDSAQWCLTQPLREAWIAPLPEDQDPIYERLYDRFYAIMHDAARQWALTSARVWGREADGEPDDAKTYAVCRLIKALAVAHDLLSEHFTGVERDQVQSTLTALCRHYFRGYFTTAPVQDESFCAHHAIVEWAGFGVAALSLLGDVTDADDWLDASIRKFEHHLLPLGIADDGAQTEGTTFWASTMQYRLFFMDALRRVTGHDLFGRFADQMSGRFAMACVTSEHRPGRMESNRSVAMHPSYGQLDYLAPVLLKLAAEYHDPTMLRLASWDHSLGGIQRTIYTTPNARETLLFTLGGYACVWFDPELPDEAIPQPCAFVFPSIGQAYARAGWEPGNALVALDALSLQVHGGGMGLLLEDRAMPWAGIESQQPAVVELKHEDDGNTAVIDSQAPELGRLNMTVRRDNHVELRRDLAEPLACWSHGPMARHDNTLIWPDRARGQVICGRITRFDPQQYRVPNVVGMGKLPLPDDDPIQYPVVCIEPDDGRIEIAIDLDSAAASS